MRKARHVENGAGTGSPSLSMPRASQSPGDPEKGGTLFRIEEPFLGSFDLSYHNKEAILFALDSDYGNLK